jgi:hypothetical protein
MWQGGQQVHYECGIAAPYGGHYEHHEPSETPFIEFGGKPY